MLWFVTLPQLRGLVHIESLMDLINPNMQSWSSLESIQDLTNSLLEYVYILSTLVPPSFPNPGLHQVWRKDDYASSLSVIRKKITERIGSSQNKLTKILYTSFEHTRKQSGFITKIKELYA